MRIFEDIKVGLERDPATRSALELFLTSPGLHAIWAYRIAHNTYLDLIRRESTRSHLNDALEPLEGRADNSPEFTENAIINITVRSALLKIPKDQAEAVSLVWVDGYTYEQAGQMLGVPAGTIKSRVSRARPVLAEILRELDPQARN